jgi:DNA modification methylase
MELNKIHLGDAYKLIKEIPDKSVDCIYTDIPYLIDGGGGGNSELSKRIIKMKNTLIDSDIYDGINYDILNDFIRISKKLNLFIWCSKSQLLDIMKFFIEKGYNFNLLVWGKTNPTPATNNVWLPDLEYCLHFKETGIKLNDGYELKSKWFISPLNMDDKNQFGHPTIKPLELVKRHLLHATQENDIILDPFMGSGTTALAAKEIKRQFVGFEIDSDYHKIAVDRLNGINKGGQTSIFTDFDNL